MPLVWNEIRSRAYAFVRKWHGETREQAEAKPVFEDFLNVFGVSRRRVASFEHHVKKLGGKHGFIDCFWPGVLLHEQKSRGADLSGALEQANDYSTGLSDAELPHYLSVCDFDRFMLYDFDQHGKLVADFTLDELPDHVEVFAFIAGYPDVEIRPEGLVNVEAAQKMGKFHDALSAAGYSGHRLEVFLVRLLYCLFAKNTGIFRRNSFEDFLTLHTREDGSDLGGSLSQLFATLDTPVDQRPRTLPEYLTPFPHINGSLFAEKFHPTSLDSAMRDQLLDACRLDWGRISPPIFGALFQSVGDQTKRRQLGKHYTSEENILKVVNALFLDQLLTDYAEASNSKQQLEKFHDKLVMLRFLDPACGCGNFLAIAYRELRMLELNVLVALYPDPSPDLDLHALIRVSVDQFYGIEIEEFPSQIAQVALWLVDHQVNRAASRLFGQLFVRLPLIKNPS